MHHLSSVPIRHYVATLLFLSVRLLSADPTTTDELWKTAYQLWRSNDLDSVIGILEHIERQQPGDRQAQVGIASVYHRQKEYDKALDILNALLAAEPRDFMLLQRIGEVYTDMREIPKALEFLLAAEREIDPTNTAQLDTLMHGVALAYHHGRDFTTAEIFFKRVGEGGRSAAFYLDYGVTLNRLGKILEAADAFNDALAIDPTQGEARINLAALHHQHGDVNESIPHYLNVINSPSASAQLKNMAMGNVGVAYELTKDIVSALSWYERALHEIVSSPDTVYPDGLTAQMSFMHLMVHIVRAKLSACVWANAEDEFSLLWTMVTTLQTATDARYAFTPFDSLLHAMSPLDRRSVAVRFSTKFTTGEVETRIKEVALPVKLHEGRQSKQLTSLNVGYLSYDFSDHPTTHLMEGIFATRERGSIKTVAFGYGRDDGSAVRQRVIDKVDRFFDLSTASFEESAKMIRAEHIHILMDAQGHTRGGRMQIAAARPAPIVVNYLVYPGTSGAPFVDYVIVDKYVVPPAELATAFTEKLVILPNCYQVNYYDQILASSETISRRSDLWDIAKHEGGDEGFVFVNFNKIDKLKASLFSTWMSTLRRVPRSSLLLLDPGRNELGDDVTESVTSREIKKNLWKEAQAQGISRGRVRFVSRIPKAEHLLRHHVGGLFLDTFIYGAHSTATDALYAGLPVITLAGDSFASRVGVSLLRNLGMEEVITFSVKEYEDLAVYLAMTPSVLSRLQRRLRSDKAELEQPLFRTKQHTQHLEQSQRLMYEVYSLTNRTFHLVV
ncbi:Glycosyl transferase family 41 [Phytophthora infestans]|uniref:protein O-GlcNAc transferase n=1 Tax=Phytophthora infestans TaxID=4787 RepID=A0A833SY49_PHYIN|nr:Glycosyl transferase family 41 [Phytophthora infestans]